MGLKHRHLLLGLVLLTTALALPTAAWAVEAPFWQVAGKRLESGATRTASIGIAGTEVTIHGTLGTSKVEIRCKEAAVSSGGIEGSSAKHVGKAFGFLELAKCVLFAEEGGKFVEQKKCEVVGFKSLKLAGGLLLEGKKSEAGTKTIIALEPKELTGGKPLIAEITIKKVPGETCAFEATADDLEGSFAARLSPEDEEVKAVNWVFPATAIASGWRPPSEEGEITLGLKLAGNTASIQGELKTELTSKETFGGGATFENTFSYRNGWLISGTALAGAAALSTTARVDEEYEWVFPLLGTVRCGSSTLSAINPQIESPHSSSATSLTFGECAVTSGGECELSSNSIVTLPIVTEVTLDGALAARGVFKPKTVTTFATIKFQGTNCAETGKLPLTGTISWLAPTDQDERVSQMLSINVTAASGELKLQSSAASLKGSYLLRLK